MKPIGDETTIRLQLPGGRAIVATRGEDRYWAVSAEDGRTLPSKPPHSRNLRVIRHWVRNQPAGRPRGKPRTAGPAAPGSFGDLLRQARERKRWTPEEAAEKAGVSCRAWYNWEAGQGEPKISVVCRLARVLGCESVVELAPEGR